jgi:circadian clock protein KaiB
MIKARKRGRARPATAKRATYVFRLFVAGHESNSAQARENLARICAEHLPGRCKVEIVDVLTDAASAYDDGVLVTPTLILIAPRPRVTLLGSLNDSRRVMAELRLVR